MQVHEAAAVVESGGDAGDAVATRRRLRGGEGPVGVLEEVGRWRHRSTSSVAVLPEPSTLPVGDATDLGKDYSQLYATLDHCVNRPRAPHAYFAAPVRGRRAV
jgi:hypothetical protein